ncbi:hypothetical protein ACGFZB_28695 [Streptomyces cinerochromogenes]|uniref:Uncharacterized protein n=1 Tax=Streptomyces cinerochromogenes TaxID=66422 RepID=A0ABW7BAU1_9ACTN
MKYRDRGGDTWEDVTPGYIRVVVMNGVEVDHAEPWDVDYVTEKWGPLCPVDEAAEEAGDDPAEPDLPTVESVMGRSDIFQAAHALVNGLTWGETASVYDVLQVAKWLEGEG